MFRLATVWFEKHNSLILSLARSLNIVVRLNNWDNCYSKSMLSFMGYKGLILQFYNWLHFLSPTIPWLRICLPIYFFQTLFALFYLSIERKCSQSSSKKLMSVCVVLCCVSLFCIYLRQFQFLLLSLIYIFVVSLYTFNRWLARLYLLSLY